MWVIVIKKLVQFEWCFEFKIWFMGIFINIVRDKRKKVEREFIVWQFVVLE